MWRRKIMKYSLGLDIGTASIGWAVINEDKWRIEDLGVRIFERPENPKNGESLALPRRTARSTRRRFRRRRQRLDYLKRYFIINQLLTPEQIDELFCRNKKSKHNRLDPYVIRRAAIFKKVSNEELFVALYHIAKRRGYKSNRKKVEENDKDSGKVLAAIKANKDVLNKYRTIGEALASDDRYLSHKRNKLESYDNSFIREDFESEARLILQTQGWNDNQIENLLHDSSGKFNGIFDQRPFMDEKLIAQMRGHCPYESGEPRACRASYSFELFRLAQDLIHAEYNKGQKLTTDQIITCIEKAKKTRKVTYKAIREALGFKSVEDFQFDYVRGKQNNDYREAEKNVFCELKFYHDIKKKASEDFSRIESNPDLFDQIGYILTVNKDDAIVESQLSELKLSSSSIEGLMSLSYSGFAHLSNKCIRKITPHLLDGMTYDKAIEAEYPGRFTEKLSGDKSELPCLTPEQANQITNPVVRRAIGQTRKVVNAIVRKYGAPTQIKIECTNELAKSFRERQEIDKKQKENAERNQAIVDQLKNDFGITNPTGSLIIKKKLYEQQLCKCLYCGESLGPEIFMDDKLSEIDHIIPFSRCGNDSLNNKALVCARCNQEKTNYTPFEKWHNDPDRWAIISRLAEASNIPPSKRKRILAEKAPKEEWNTRALNDTRYIMRFMSRYIKSNLKFSEDSKGRQKVILPTGFITSYLRKMYHLGRKDRELDNRHHAVDACIIATISQGQICKFSEWNKCKELGARLHSISYSDENGNIKQVSRAEYEEMTAELLPWKDFDKEVMIRAGMMHDIKKIENLADFRDRFRAFESYDEEFLQKIHPLFVSRMPRRRIGGQAHKDTIRSPKITGDNLRLTRKRLDKDFRPSDLRFVEESDPVLYSQLKRIFDENGDDAFKNSDIKVYKNNKTVDKKGRPLSPVSSVKVYSTEPSGILINHGTQFVNNGDMVCLNIYKRSSINGSERYYAAPVYVHSVNAKKFAILPTPKGSSAAEKADIESLVEDGKVYATEENGFKQVFSIFPNDYIRLTYSDKIVEGYYVSYDIASNRVSLIAHDQPNKKNIERCSLGQVVKITKINISVLGDNYYT